MAGKYRSRIKRQRKLMRPVCTLDKQAMMLGVYSKDFHVKSRYERSAIVHQAKAEEAKREAA